MKTLVVNSVLVMSINTLLPIQVFGKSVTYEYDQLGRLGRMTYQTGEYVGFGYDPVGNRQALTIITDTDLDGVLDDVDNCLLVKNDSQRDTNSDGFGNACDPDFDNSCIVNAGDLGFLSHAYLSVPGDPNYLTDVDLDDFIGINSADLAFFASFYLKQPGPSALATCP